MSVTLYREQELTKDDLNIYIQDLQGNYFNPFRITYTIYRVTSDKFYNQLCGEEPILETINSPGIPFGIGEFFAPWKMPKDILLGPYRIKWDIKQYFDSPIFQEVEEFEIIEKGILNSDTAGTSARMGPFPHQEYVGNCPEAS